MGTFLGEEGGSNSLYSWSTVGKAIAGQREDLVGSSDSWEGKPVWEVPHPAQPLPTADPSPVPASRGQGPGLGQDLRGHRPGRDPGAQLLQGGPCPAALSLQSLRGAYPGQGGWSLLDFHPWDSLRPSSSNSSLLTACE